MGYDIDELIENGEKDKIKKLYEENFEIKQEKPIEKIEKPVETPVQRNNAVWVSW